MKRKVVCPFCNKIILLGIELGTLQAINSPIYFPHIHIHGTPLHALICYLSSDLQIRNVSVIKSIEISRDSETFSQCMKKWTNPY